ncbi:17033_t:CDS:1 [Cetraspora pellucida]|uniref:17033_t:CDS:1 n=1 Tax=Cetraspora pellucida TaxID=1433469 RepID=A0A9N9BSA6_9GLOM|nr:17033_t:CDS:1 [Cetraspora pellucida]
MDSNNSNNLTPDYIELATGGSYMQHQRPLNPITTSLSTPPIITTAYNGTNGNGAGGAITPPPDSSRSSGAQPLRIAPAQYSNIIPTNYVNISNNLAGLPGFQLQNIAAQCCLPNQQYFTNDTSNQNKIVSVSKQNIQPNAPCDANSSARPPSLQQQERPESIVFLYQIPNDSKIYLVKCVEVSQLLDTDYHSLEGILHNRSQQQQQVQQNLKNHLQQHLQTRLQPPPSQQPLLYQQQQITLQQNQIRHHPYQQRQSPKESVHNTIGGKNVKTPASNNFQANINNQEISQFSVDMNNAGNFDMMIPMSATPGAPYMVTPSATPTMRNDHLGNNMEYCVSLLAQQQQMLTASTISTQQQQVFDTQYKK